MLHARTLAESETVSEIHLSNTLYNDDGSLTVDGVAESTDTFQATEASEHFMGQEGDGDTVIYGPDMTEGISVVFEGAGSARGYFGADQDFYTHIEAFVGTAFRDDFYSTDMSTGVNFDGGDGDDYFFINGNDTVIGGAGFDRVSAIDSPTGQALNMVLDSDDIELVRGARGDDTVDASANTVRTVLIGFNGDDVLTGGSGNDLLQGGNGDDVLIGGAGHDRIDSDAGADIIDGGDGNDNLFIDAQDSVMGGAGIDRVFVRGYSEGVDLDIAAAQVEIVFGNLRDDSLDASMADYDVTISGARGNDVIDGGSGNDWLNGGLDDDIITGGAGDDSIFANQGVDIVDAGSGDDLIRVSSDTALVDGGADFDTVRVTGDTGLTAATILSNIELVFGSAFSDVIDVSSHTESVILQGGGGDDTLIGGSGNDTIYTDGGADVANAGAGDDTLYIDDQDTILGGEGIDTVYVQASSGAVDLDMAASEVEIVYGSTGHDTLDASAALYAVEIFGARGDDVIDGGSGEDFLVGGLGDDIINGGAGDDDIFANQGADTAYGGAGDDLIRVNHETLLVDGGDGIDTIYVTGTAGLEAGLQLIDVEFVFGSQFDDVIDLTGSSTAASLMGGEGNDLLIGGLANDVLDGGAGNDEIMFGDGLDSVFGGDGEDIFSFVGTDEEVDMIEGFTVGEDSLDFSNLSHLNILGLLDLTLTQTSQGTLVSMEIGGADCGFLLVDVALADLDPLDFIF